MLKEPQLFYVGVWILTMFSSSAELRADMSVSTSGPVVSGHLPLSQLQFVKPCIIPGSLQRSGDILQNTERRLRRRVTSRIFDHIYLSAASAPATLTAGSDPQTLRRKCAKSSTREFLFHVVQEIFTSSNYVTKQRRVELISRLNSRRSNATLESTKLENFLSGSKLGKSDFPVAGGDQEQVISIDLCNLLTASR